MDAEAIAISGVADGAAPPVAGTAHVTLSTIVGVTSAMLSIVGLSVGPAFFSIIALGLLVVGVAVSHAANSQAWPKAAGVHRWVGPGAARLINAYVWTSIVGNALGACRYFSGVDTVAWFQDGWDDWTLNEARECGTGWATVDFKCVDFIPMASFVAYPWALYWHVSGAVTALFIGPFQLWKSFRRDHLTTHRWMGRVYAAAVTVGGTGALALAAHTTSGIVGASGFAALAVAWLASMARAVKLVWGGDITRHREWMLYNYSLTFAAVTLRIQLPILSSFMDFRFAYATVAWLAWVPNLAAAVWFVRTTRQAGEPESEGREDGNANKAALMGVA